jgi:tetratricopeptide (TPR) repeat protein
MALTGLLMKEGLYEKALDFLREAFVHHAEDAGIRVKMAVCHLKLEEHELAQKFLEEGLSMKPELETEFAYYFPVGSRNEEIEHIIQLYKK